MMRQRLGILIRLGRVSWKEDLRGMGTAAACSFPNPLLTHAHMHSGLAEYAFLVA